MTKDIYIITNDINNKVYIGQAKDTAERFRTHCKPNAAKDNSIIDKAIQKFGKEHFKYTILESQVEDYNEREKYWIKYYNSITPNGYNILEGGNEPPVYYGIEHPNAVITDQDTLIQLKNDLKNTTMPLSEIARKYEVSKRTVLRINQGIHYASLSEHYPLREKPNMNGKLTDEDVLEIIDILQYSYRQYEDIAAEYHVNINTIKNINLGYCHVVPDIEYPIRNYKNSGVPAVTYEEVTEIIKLIKQNTMSLRAIAKKYNISNSTVQGINNGSMKRYRRKDETYPIRNYTSF